jgi:hypothetical protein
VHLVGVHCILQCAAAKLHDLLPQFSSREALLPRFLPRFDDALENFLSGTANAFCSGRINKKFQCFGSI